MWVKREIEPELLDLASQYPVVMITGPRQAGKTSLARKTFPDKPYFSFENPDVREQISLDPRAFFSANSDGAIIDEFQRYPDILSYIQGVNGFYPGIYSEGLNPVKAYRNYYETYVERDIRQILQVKDLVYFQRFVKLCAGRVGQLFNASSLATEVGVSSMTIHTWLSALEATFIVFWCNHGLPISVKGW